MFHSKAVLFIRISSNNNFNNFNKTIRLNFSLLLLAYKIDSIFSFKPTHSEKVTFDLNKCAILSIL